MVSLEQNCLQKFCFFLALFSFLLILRLYLRESIKLPLWRNVPHASGMKAECSAHATIQGDRPTLHRGVSHKVRLSLTMHALIRIHICKLYWHDLIRVVVVVVIVAATVPIIVVVVAVVLRTSPRVARICKTSNLLTKQETVVLFFMTRKRLLPVFSFFNGIPIFVFRPPPPFDELYFLINQGDNTFNF